MNKVEIIGLGEVVIDWVAEVPYFPKPDEKIDAINEQYFPGGVTANFLVAVARLGISCGFIGAVGDDSYGDFLLNDFDKENVDTSFTIRKSSRRTPINFIFIAKGEKTIIQSPHMYTTKLEISDINESYIAEAKLLHTTIIHPELTKKAIKIAKEHDVKISIDLEPQIAQRGWGKLEKIISKADIIIPNKEGAKLLTKCNTPKKAADCLIKKGIPIVVITLGSKGALVATREFQKEIPSFKVDNIIDTTGAGDTFNGALSVAYWIKNLDLEKSITYANAAAALKIQKLGARTGTPNESELLSFLKDKNISKL